MNPQIGISDRNRKAIAQILNRTLANEVLLLVKTKNYHWNVTGPDFSEYHKFFDEQYEKLNDFVDEVAERVRALGERPVGTLAEFQNLTTLKEAATVPPARTMIENLLRDHERLIRELREDLDACGAKLGDMGTSDFLTGLLEEHEKMAWMLRAFL